VSSPATGCEPGPEPATDAAAGTDVTTGPSAGPATAAAPDPAAAGTAGPAVEPLAACVHCGKPTEYPESTRGVTLCPVCEWQEAQRTACSG
jgi:hypothetical protein